MEKRKENKIKQKKSKDSWMGNLKKIFIEKLGV